MADEEDKSSKTEEPSERKLQKAREKGNVPKSREVNNFFILLAIILAILMTLPYSMATLLEIYGGAFTEAASMRLNSKQDISQIMYIVTIKGIQGLLPTMVLLMIFAYFSSVLQTGFLASSEQIKPKLSKISLIKGLERMFSAKALMEFLKSVIKLIVVGAVMFIVFYIHDKEFLLLTDKTIMDLVILIQIISVQIILAALAIAFILAVIDFIFQKAEYTKNNRMSRKELKDEYKEVEGDPHIKGRQRQIRMERARARMMQELPTADVVVTNPTHYAVALRYDKATEAAPRIIAKGVDHLAVRIREIAADNDIPLYEDPPLARQLYAETEINEEIPLELYEAVAKVIAFIYNVKGNKNVA